jgi:hypothetical protein
MAVEISTTTRRSALRGLGFTALAAGLAVPALAIPDGADAELIRQCDAIVAIRGRLDAVYAVRHTMADEERTEPELELDVLFEQREEACARIEALPAVSTLDGARALARASLAMAERHADRTISIDTDSEWPMAELAVFLAKGDIA